MKKSTCPKEVDFGVKKVQSLKSGKISHNSTKSAQTHHLPEEEEPKQHQQPEEKEPKSQQSQQP